MFGRPRYGGRRRRGYGGLDPYTVIMGMRLFQQVNNIEDKPPVTLAVMAANILVKFQTNYLIPFNPLHIVYNRDLESFLLSPFFHIDERHLLYNMTSFLYKGYHLERQVGPEVFALILGSLLIASQGIFLALSFLAEELTHDNYTNVNTVGFSGVVFALKVLVNSELFMDPNQMTQFFGFQFRLKQLVWVELIFAQMLNPGASFLGHLAGILAGMVVLQIYKNQQHRVSFASFGTTADWQTPPHAETRRTETRRPTVPQPPKAEPAQSEPDRLSREELRRRRLERFEK